MPLAKRCLLIELGNREISIAKQCIAMSIHRSKYYYQSIAEPAENCSIILWLDKQYFDTPFYGVLRLTVELNDFDYVVNEKRVRRLMKLIGWKTLYQQPRTTIADKTS